ncbi:plasma membrane iron permease [Sphaerosporella brunnea]|uniref:Plasma membrane iron permease n=1 Tax=Sphaerosporella brunnea TaxID=1250544 RepID=A0A5J5EEP5_9PEZI|nr:plasma membrane iron permease [Sphaerosporella brunnea]
MGRALFNVPVFFIVFRETLETSIICGILLSFIKQTVSNTPAVRKRLVRQVWVGTVLGFLICLCVGAGLIGAFYSLSKKDLWSKSEDLYEGIFSLIASIIITLMGAVILRVNKMQDAWREKLAVKSQSGVSGWGKRYAMFLLPFITVLREGLEAVVFVAGVGLTQPATAFPLPAITGLLAGSVIGYVIYKGGVTVGVRYFLIASTALLYLVAAGLLSKAAWSIDTYEFVRLVGGDVAETGAGPGSYNIHRTVWHVNCCSPKVNGGGGWGVFNSLFGWQNSATYSSVLTYNIYWIVVSAWFLTMAFKEKNGRYPFMKAPASSTAMGQSSPQTGSVETVVKTGGGAVREVSEVI